MKQRGCAVMTSTVKIEELNKIINIAHGDPHHVLGMHEVKINNKSGLSVRAFIPQAKSVTVIDPKDEKYSLALLKIHDDGFFEGNTTHRQNWFRYKLKIENYSGDVWETYDSYSFAPIISELDRYLFGEGTHYKIYDKLGAHCLTVDGVEGVLFAVWAPNAASVSVVGNFNSWDGRRNAMRILGNSGIWEIFIPGLSQYEIYKYEIKTRDNALLLKSDPYGFFSEMRPNTASVVYDIEGYDWNDSTYLQNRAKNNPFSRPMNIYEVHLGSWKRKAEENNRFLTYRELAAELIAYVKEMGYTHIELMPVSEYPFDGSWGYQVTGYYAATSRYGEPKDLMYFIDVCHQNNIGVIIDWVPAHFPKDAPGLARFDGTALYEHLDPKQGEHPDWGTLIFNYGRGEVKNFLIANALFWIEKYHIDGLRVDAVASMLYLDYGKNDGEWIPNEYGGNENWEAVEFLKHMNSIVSNMHRHVMMIAEESTAWGFVSRPPEENGLGFNLKWNMGWMNDFLRYISKDPIYRKHHHNDLTFSMVYAYTENFILVLSHDEVVHGKGSLINKMPGDLWQKFANLRVAQGFMFAHPGKKLNFMGGEFGQFAEWSEDKSLDWFLLEYAHHQNMLSYTKALNQFYLQNKCLWERDFTYEGFEWIDSNDYMRSILIFVRKGFNPDDFIVFICNFTPETYFKHRIGVPKYCNYVEVFNSDRDIYGGSNVINEGVLSIEDMHANGRSQSITIQLPPLGIAAFKPI